ncbi:MAG: hypothetical protein PHX10_14160 [Gallionellaceae bacterium]|nr:hypothetical protein [Gallionellaceae bacterium]
MSYLIDIAFEEMSAAFVLSHDSGIRTDEAYRMFAAGQRCLATPVGYPGQGCSRAAGSRFG